MGVPTLEAQQLSPEMTIGELISFIGNPNYDIVPDVDDVEELPQKIVDGSALNWYLTIFVVETDKDRVVQYTYTRDNTDSNTPFVVQGKAKHLTREEFRAQH